MDTKRCRRCGERKPLDQFYAQSKRRKDGRKVDGSRGGKGVLALCKSCWQEYNQEGRLRRRYGLTPAELAAMKAAGCVVCGGHGRLSVDHDHRNGKVRGLLCGNCNTGLGMFQDSPTRMRAAAAYIEEWQRAHA